jgi:hypothetical protein
MSGIPSRHLFPSRASLQYRAPGCGKKKFGEVLTVRCPACDERVLDFAVWGQGINAFRKLDCQACGAKLRPSRRTVVLFIVLMISTVPIAIGVAILLEMVGLAEPVARMAFGVVIIPLAVMAAYYVWKTGYYSLRAS